MTAQPMFTTDRCKRPAVLPQPCLPAPALRRVALAACLALSALAPWHSSQAQAPAAAPARAGEPVVLNFVGAEIEAVARTMATITGRNVVVDPRVRGTINLATERPVQPAAALNQFAAVLRLQGFALVDTGGLYKIVPEADAKLQGTVVSAGAVSALPTSNQIVTQIFRLNHESANNLVPILRPLIGPNNTINVNPGTNALVITDYADNLQRLGRIIAALDVAGATDVEVIPLQHAVAADLAALVGRLIESGTPGGGAPTGAGGQAGDASYRTTLLAEPRSNSLVLRAANPARVALVRSLVARLDQPTSQNASGNIHVVYLKNADAVSLATTLRAALASEAASGGGAAGGGASTAATATTRLTGTGGTSAGNGSAATSPVTASAAPSTGGQIQADPATNALIITAPEPQYRQLRAVIDQLDTRRAQVFVESLIVEVNADKLAEFGVQWQGLLGRNGSTQGVIGTNSGVTGANILGLTAGLAAGGNALGAAVNSLNAGLNLALAPTVNGRQYLGALANFLQQNGDGNVLSTPNLLTLDNEEAKIVIGQNVPFLTGRFTNTGANEGSANPFQTIERRDVGLTLRVRPQISENGTIKMTLFQEVSTVERNSADGPTTNKRTLESTVLVEDGGIVVLGGLLQDRYEATQEKVPGLGDIPIIGNLFKSESRQRNKTNLMLFLRPVVMRDARETSTLAMDRYEIMRAIQREAQPVPSQVVPINEAPLMPVLGAPAATPAAPVVVTPVPGPALAR
jgi:general secretion pathway protein D